MIKPIALALAVGFFLGIATRADDSVSPYIDSLKKQIDQKDAQQGTKPPSDDQSYTEQQKKKLAPGPSMEGDQPYLDSLKKSHPKEFEEQKTDQSYTEQQKAAIGPGDEESAIDKVHKGTSALTMKRPGKVTGAFGFSLGLGVDHNVTANNQPGNPTTFEEVYGGHFVPDVTFFGEHQFFHNETYGSLGVVASLQINYYWGYGQYAIPLFQPSGDAFPSTSLTKFSFGAIPISVGADYRFSLGHTIKPFVMIKPTLIPFFELRDDGVAGHQGLSKAIYTNGGINILLDGMDKDLAWDLYSDYNIKHVYLTIEFVKLTTFASDVVFNYYGADVGFTFEY